MRYNVLEHLAQSTLLAASLMPSTWCAIDDMSRAQVYELGEPNFREWKEYDPPFNVFPGINDFDPDSPHQASSDRETKELFDGHGGIIGLEVFLP